MVQLKVAKLTDEIYALNNQFNHNKDDFNGLTNIYVKIFDTVYPSVHTSIDKGVLGLGFIHRSKYRLSFNEKIDVELYNIKNENKISEMTVKISKKGKDNNIVSLHEDNLKEQIYSKLTNYYICNNQSLLFEYEIGKQVILEIKTRHEGFLTKNCNIILESIDVSLNIISSKIFKRELFSDNYNFEEIGIGGLNKELINIFRRALSTRAIKPSQIEKLGINHVKGMLLYGPPGTGKTLIARRIGHIISEREPKVINGPEILDKYIGQSEQNIRNIFADAKKDYETNKENADLHIIIFDEIDAICRSRGKSGTQSTVTDSIVNQLLSMIDGVNALNNIFIIAMTNRKDLIDPALLRAGRLEIHIEIGLPNQIGREQIFRIHTAKMSYNHLLHSNVNITKLAELTDNYSGAEIEAVVKNAASYSIHELLASSKDNINDDDIIVKMEHFITAVNEISPMFGDSNKQIIQLLPSTYLDLTDSHRLCYQQVINYFNNKNRLKTIMIYGENGTGKTTLALKLTYDSKIKYTKIIRAIDLISMDENYKTLYISDIISNAYLTDNSLIVIDDIEIAINYANLYNNISFSNKLYQMLMTILKTSPLNPNNKVTILVTCGNLDLFTMLDKNFDLVLQIDKLSSTDLQRISDELNIAAPSNLDLSIKQLLKYV